jgi:ribosomal protein S18 acetylase RimI-like enzyme
MTRSRATPAAASDTVGGSHPLDNVVWSALTTRQSEFSEGDDRARRYLIDVAPFAGLRDFSPASMASLLPLASSGQRLAIFSVDPMPPAQGLEVVLAKTGHQMIASRVAAPLQPRDVERLDDSSVPEMLALVERSQPGPFAERTNRLGDYLGIRAGGQLIAMTGERMKLDGFTEISAVCTHPDHRGHGYAHDLVSLVAQAVLDRGERPFLHVFSENRPAITLYERLGFTIRRTMHVTIVAAKS